MFKRGGTPLQDGRRIDAAIAGGLERAKAAGCPEPTLRDAVWQLLLEAGETLRRLPNRERGWLTAVSRSHWPDYLQRSADEMAVGRMAGQRGGRPLPAQPEAIDRLDIVLLWLPHAGGANPRRDIGILFGLACGLKVAVLRRQFGCGRRTVYDVRDRGIARICGWLREQSDVCRHLA